MATTDIQRKTYSSADNSFTEFFLFDQFDPALGTFLGVTIENKGRVTADLAVESLEAEAAAVSVAITAAAYPATISLMAPAFGIVATSGTLAAFDGSADFSGASAVAAAGVVGPWSASGSDNSAELALRYTGTGVAFALLSIASTLDVTGGANMRVRTDVLSVEGELGLSYDYTPAGGGGGGGGGVVITMPNPPVFEAVAQVTMTTPRQRFSLAERTTGWTDTVGVAEFDPSLGTLVGVNLTLSTSLRSNVAVETLQRGGTVFAAVTQTVKTTVGIAGLDALATAEATSSRTATIIDQPDGVEDFAGTGGLRLAEVVEHGSKSLRVTDSGAIAPFIGTGTLDLAVHAGGTGRIAGMAELLAELTASAGATLDVSYTYLPAPGVTPIAVANTSKGTQSEPTPGSYTGPVTGIVNTFAQITTDNLAISAKTDSWYIRTGDGMDAIQVRNGRNVLDGGGGSNFLVGGEGQDSFFLDGLTPTAPLWSTVIGMDPGDTVTLWGYTPSHTLAWFDNEGAVGAQGLTAHMRAPNGPLVLATLVGYSTADLSNGTLHMSSGIAGDLPYLLITA